MAFDFNTGHKQGRIFGLEEAVGLLKLLRNKFPTIVDTPDRMISELEDYIKKIKDEKESTDGDKNSERK